MWHALKIQIERHWQWTGKHALMVLIKNVMLEEVGAARKRNVDIINRLTHQWCFQLHLVENITPLRPPSIHQSCYCDSVGCFRENLEPLIFSTLFPCISQTGDMLIKSSVTAGLRHYRTKQLPHRAWKRINGKLFFNHFPRHILQETYSVSILILSALWFILRL